MKLSRLVPLLLFAVTTIVCAEPSPTVKYLMTAPASMFDIGIAHLNFILLDRIQHRDAFAVHGATPGTWAEYKWDDNRVEINLSYADFTLHAPKQTDDLESECHRIIDKVRSYFKYEIVWGHAQYQHKDEPENLHEEMNKITVIKLFFVTSSEKVPFGVYNCEGRMTETSISVVK